LDETSDCIITDNVFSCSAFGGGGETIRITKSQNCEITQNSISDGFTGIFLDNSNDTTISDNILTGFIYGAIFGDFANTTLTNNELIRTGVRLEFWYPRLAQNLPILKNNTVNGKDLGIFFNLLGAHLETEQYGQIILGNCNDTTISGGVIANCATGIELVRCNNCTLANHSVSNCSWNGINIERCPQTTITDCRVINCSETAIFLSTSPFFTIENCTLRDNREGILPHIYSNNGTVVNCTILGKTPDIYGIGINLSNNSTAIGNIISENYIGIYVYGAHCLVVNNTITRNGYGINIGEAYTGYGEDSYANRIYGNEIGWNSLANAYDVSWRYNEWDDGVSIGNSWSDYYGIGYYVITRDVVDHFPRLLPNDGIPLFYIHLGVVFTSIIAIVAIFAFAMKRRVNTSE
jgi:parallel beta-helix repeat protein